MADGVREQLAAGQRVLKFAKLVGIRSGTVQRAEHEMVALTSEAV